MANTYLFSATMAKSGDSRVAQVMNLLDVDQVVCFTIRGGSDQMRAHLHNLVGSGVLACLPIRSARHPQWRRQLWILQVTPGHSDYESIAAYRAILRFVFGDHCRIAVRVIHRTLQKGGAQ